MTPAREALREAVERAERELAWTKENQSEFEYVQVRPNDVRALLAASRLLLSPEMVAVCEAAEQWAHLDESTISSMSVSIKALAALGRALKGEVG